MIDVWIIEDNEGFRSTICRALNQAGGIRCSAAFGSCEEGLAKLKITQGPEVLLQDINLPGMSGVEGVRLFTTRSPQTRAIMLTVFDDYTNIMQALCSGASGYVLKTSSLETIIGAISEVMNGGAPMSPPIARAVLNLFTKFTPPPSVDHGLSPREKEVLQLLVQGLGNKEVADRLNLSPHTVDKHIRGIYDKLHVHSRSAAVAKAVQEKLF